MEGGYNFNRIGSDRIGTDTIQYDSFADYIGKYTI
jgi:hypothetical protein